MQRQTDDEDVNDNEKKTDEWNSMSQEDVRSLEESQKEYIAAITNHFRQKALQRTMYATKKWTKRINTMTEEMGLPDLLSPCLMQPSRQTRLGKDGEDCRHASTEAMGTHGSTSSHTDVGDQETTASHLSPILAPDQHSHKSKRHLSEASLLKADPRSKRVTRAESHPHPILVLNQPAPKKAKQTLPTKELVRSPLNSNSPAKTKSHDVNPMKTTSHSDENVHTS